MDTTYIQIPIYFRAAYLPDELGLAQVELTNYTHSENISTEFGRRTRLDGFIKS